jgi:two-component system, OmpR family, response regulator MprA
MRLLVVDDDRAVREALALVLDLNGFEVATAEDWREAIRTLAVAPPDAVILDVLMRASTGSRSAGGCARSATARPC